MSPDFTAANDLGKVDRPNKDGCVSDHGVQAPISVKDKRLIVDCAEDPGEKRVPEMQQRMGSLENRLEEMGKHFVKYQEDVAAILVQECVRLTHQMQEQKENLQKKTHDQVQKAVSAAKEEIMGEINMEWSRMRDFVNISSSISSGKCKEDMSTRETASTASASDDLEAPGELVKLMGEARKDIDAIQIALSNHIKVAEKRFVDLEMVEKTKEARDEGDVTLSKAWCQKLGHRTESQQQLIDQFKDSIIYEARLSPRPKSSECIAEFDTVLKNLVTAVTTALPMPSATNESDRDASPMASKRESSRQQVRHGSCDSVRCDSVRSLSSSMSFSAARGRSETATVAFPAGSPSRRCASPVMRPVLGAACQAGIHFKPASLREKSVSGGSHCLPMPKPAPGGSFQLPMPQAPGTPKQPPVIDCSQLQHRTTLPGSLDRNASVSQPEAAAPQARPFAAEQIRTTAPQPSPLAAEHVRTTREQQPTSSTNDLPIYSPATGAGLAAAPRVARAANGSTVFRPRPLLEIRAGTQPCSTDI